MVAVKCANAEMNVIQDALVKRFSVNLFCFVFFLHQYYA